MRKIWIFIASLVIIPSLVFAGSVYYVDATNGNNAYNGLSPSTAWQTMEKARSSMGIFNPGDSILFNRGDTWTGASESLPNDEFRITRSGSAGGGYITFGAYGSGNLPEFQNIKVKGYVTGLSYVKIEYWRVNGSPSGVNNGIDFQKSGQNHIIVDHCEIVNSNNNAVFIRYVDTFEVTNCTIYDYANSGIVVYGDPGNNASNGIISNNDVDGDGSANDCVTIHRDGDYEDVGSNFLLENNVCYDSTEQGFDITAGSNIVLRNNETYGHSGSGIVTGWGADNVWIDKHYSHEDGYFGIIFNVSTNVKLTNSVIYNSGDSLLYLYYVVGCEIYNNTIVEGPRGGDNYVEINENAFNATIKNNIFTSTEASSPTRFVFYHAGTTPTSQGDTYDYNLWWRGDGQSGAYFYDGNGAQTHGQWKANYGHESNSLFINPELIDPLYSNFRIYSYSPCIDIGTDVGLISDFEGTQIPQGFAPDIGAYEYRFGTNPLSASASASPTSGTAPLTVNFTGSVTGGISPYSYSWNFDDGGSSTAQNPSHAFSTAGTYTVTLTVTDNDSNQDTDTVFISATNPINPLAASVSASPTSGTAPLSVNFTGNASGGISPYSYSWNFGDGGSSSAQNPSHTYSNPGTYIAILTVTDSQSNQETDSISITVNSPPALSASASASPTSGTAPLTVNFTGSATGGTSPYSYSWSFGDGGSSSAQNPSHEYSNPSSYDVILTVTDSNSNQATDSLIITASSSTSTQQLSLSSITGSPAPGFGGTTDPSPGTHNYTSGSLVSLSAIPNTDYRFSEWEGDVIASDAFNQQVTVNLDEDKDASAYFCTRCGDVNGDLTVTASDAQGAFDIFLGRISSPTKCETENADVSCDSNVTPGDAQAIFNKFIMKGELPADCSGKTRALQAQSLSIQAAQLPGTHLIVDDAQVNGNGYVYVPIIIDNPSNIDAFGFDLQFPTEIMEFMTFDVTGLLDEYNQVDAYYTEEGLLRVGGYSGTPLLSDSPEVLITLVFRVKDESSGPLSLVITNTYDDIKNATVKDGTIINKVQHDRDPISRSERERKLNRLERLSTLLFIRF